MPRGAEFVSTNAQARAEIPSSLPTSPMPSVVVAEMLTRSSGMPRTWAIFALMAGIWSLSLGFCAKMTAETLMTAAPFSSSSFFTSIGRPFPAVCIRTSTERPEAVDKGCFIIAGIDGDSLVQAVQLAVDLNADGDCGVPVPDYTDRNVSGKVVRIIRSYTGIVNKFVWRK